MAGKVLRRAAKAAAAGLLHYSGVRKAMAAYRRWQSGGRRILIVSYHRVVRGLHRGAAAVDPGPAHLAGDLPPAPGGGARGGLRVRQLGDAVDVMAGRRVAKKDLCVVTFDDGYRDVYRYAYPVLKQMGVPAIVYLPTAFIGTDRRFNHDRLFHLIARGAEAPATARSTTRCPRRRRCCWSRSSPGAKTRRRRRWTTSSASYPTRALTEIIDALEQQLGGGAELRAASRAT